ncbi:hypothetical protein D3C72_1908830 [compost metagenome]
MPAFHLVGGDGLEQVGGRHDFAFREMADIEFSARGFRHEFAELLAGANAQVQRSGKGGSQAPT